MLYGELTLKEVQNRFEDYHSNFTEEAVELLYEYYRKREDKYLSVPEMESDWKEYSSLTEAVDALASDPDSIYKWITAEYAEEEGYLYDDLVNEKCQEWLESQDFTVLIGPYCCVVERTDIPYPH